MSKWQDVAGKLKCALAVSSKAAVSDPDAPHALERPFLRPPLNTTTSDLMTSPPLAYNHSCFPQIG